MKVADQPWFAREQVDDATWHVWEPFVDPFLRCNIWLVLGRDHAMLVDTGLGVVSLTAAARDLLDRPLLAVATHYHFDHVGSLHEFSERLAHPAAVPHLQHEMGGMLRRADADPASWQSYLDAGYELTDELLWAMPNAGFDPSAYAVPACPPTRVLDEGDVIDLGDRSYAVLHLPGHSPDSIGLYDAARGVLFSGDAVYDGPLLDNAPDADIDAYVATMERLRSLPVDVVHGGHEQSFGRERLVELCDGYIARVASY